MDKKQIRDEIYNIKVEMNTKPISEEERSNLKEQLEYYRKELTRVIYNETIKKYNEQKKEGMLNEIRK